MFGFIPGYVMQTMLQGTKLVIAFLMLATTASFAGEPVSTPKQVILVAGGAVQQKDGQLYEVDAVKHKVSPVRVPAALARELKNSSSVVFPDDHSRIIDGKEYLLVVVNHPSSSNPAGYCGAGEEGALYVLELNGDAATSRFSLPVRSCLKDYDLANDSGQKSEYSAIKWQNSPVGIKIKWDIYGDASDASRLYIYQGGQFKEVVQ
jgi:hypothetical protein